MMARRVEGRSMLPGLMPGSVVLGVRRVPVVGDVVIACVKGRDVIKRIRSIKKGRVYLVGDNSLESTDSRQYGAIKKSDILAVVMIKFPIATAAPSLKKPYGVWLGLASAALLITFALLHMFRIDTFMPELNYSVPGGYEVAKIVAVLIISAEVFAIPFVLRMRLSPLARFVSGTLVILVPLVWLLIAIWNLGISVSTAQLAAFYSLPSSYLLILFNISWLGLHTATLWTLGFDWPTRLKK